MKSRMVKLASELVAEVSPSHYTHWGKPGIRAQLYDTATRRLEMDFKFEGDSRSFHVLNAVSPAFTCAIPFSEFLVENIEKLISAGVTVHSPSKFSQKNSSESTALTHVSWLN
jgi:hypothetical protein